MAHHHINPLTDLNNGEQPLPVAEEGTPFEIDGDGRKKWILNITLPPKAKPGEICDVKVGRMKIMVMVPDGKSPGDTIVQKLECDRDPYAYQGCCCDAGSCFFGGCGSILFCCCYV